MGIREKIGGMAEAALGAAIRENLNGEVVSKIKEELHKQIDKLVDEHLAGKIDAIADKAIANWVDKIDGEDDIPDIK